MALHLRKHQHEGQTEQKVTVGSPFRPQPVRVLLTKGSPLAQRSQLFRALAVAAMFSGAALLVHILGGVSLRLTLVVAAGVMVLAVGFLWRSASAAARDYLAVCARVGAMSGLIATTSYDLTKFALSRGEALQYNPFDMFRVFGLLLAGPMAPDSVIYTSGAAFHLLNGICFGLGFCFLFGRRGIVAGIAWGLFLEAFQLALYPGWLHIRAFNEFVQLSAISHVVYGSVLGVACQRGLRNAYPTHDKRRI